jgi:hypothetical protein
VSVLLRQAHSGLLGQSTFSCDIAGGVSRRSGKISSAEFLLSAVRGARCALLYTSTQRNRPLVHRGGFSWPSTPRSGRNLDENRALLDETLVPTRLNSYRFSLPIVHGRTRRGKQ